LLIISQIAISFVNINKAESEYISAHKVLHYNDSNNGVTPKE